MADTYIAQERVRHSVTRRYYEAGQVIPVDHVSPADLAALVERGVLRKVNTPEEQPRPARAIKKEEVTDNG
jgi:hypothetical protein